MLILVLAKRSQFQHHQRFSSLWTSDFVVRSEILLPRFLRKQKENNYRKKEQAAGDLKNQNPYHPPTRMLQPYSGSQCGNNGHNSHTCSEVVAAFESTGGFMLLSVQVTEGLICKTKPSSAPALELVLEFKLILRHVGRLECIAPLSLLRSPCRTPSEFRCGQKKNWMRGASLFNLHKQNFG
uniref:Uncharacterized protein n=1 Tax=Nelumbo nucifera TaxID=4432 RepID=A0A822ZW44_NELNU|nr:TPA_asm: hypothetical protein HUJ06_017426 [Nelumbo nucifera]